jgi:hypothetical protein
MAEQDHKPNGIDRAKRVASVVGHDLQDAGPQPSERFGVHMLLADLNNGHTDNVIDLDISGTPSSALAFQ